MMAKPLLNLVLILVYPGGGALSSQSLRRNSQQKENEQLRQPNDRRMQIERRKEDVVKISERERDRDVQEAILWWYKKNEGRRNEGNRYKKNHDDQGVTPSWYRRIIKTRGYEEKSEYGIPWWYKREVKIEYTDKDLRSEDRSTGMTGNEEKTEQRRNEACVMHYNERKQTWCCTICKYCGKPVVKLC